MLGDVFEIAIAGRHDDFRHPHCVIAELSNGQALIVPGFSPDKPAVTKLEAVYFKLGIFAYPFKVTIDHGLLTNVKTKKALHKADYIIPDAVPIEQDKLHTSGELWGTLPINEVHKIAVAVLDFNIQRPTLDKAFIAGLRTLLRRI